MPEETVPYNRLGIPDDMRQHIDPAAPPAVRMVAARGLVPVAPEVQLGFLFVLSNDDEPAVRAAAVKTLRELPSGILTKAIGEGTHAKVLELIASVRPEDQDVSARIFMNKSMNERTALLIAAKAGPELCERISYNHERLLMYQGLYQALYDNPACQDVYLDKATSFLRMQRVLPEVDHPRPGAKPAKKAQPALDLEAEIEAALRGEQSPALQTQMENLGMFDLNSLAEQKDGLEDFKFDFKDEASEFGWELTDDSVDFNNDERISLEKKVRALTVGQRVKLAYVGNKMARAILVRDANSMVSVAVVKSGRLTDGEVASFAGNRNLADEVMREIASNPEWTRKYPIKVALVNNPKTPVSSAISLVSTLQKKDLNDLCHNHNISSVVGQMARRLFREKYQR